MKVSIGIDYVDGAEFHGKWPNGGIMSEVATPQDWMEEVPLQNHKYNFSYRQRTKDLRDMLKEMGVTKGLFLLSKLIYLKKKVSFFKFCFEKKKEL